eukprot:SAG22_NODE_18334_length_289_cov_0.684211_2_plen_58_part_01
MGLSVQLLYTKFRTYGRTVRVRYMYSCMHVAGPRAAAQTVRVDFPGRPDASCSVVDLP